MDKTHKEQCPESIAPPYTFTWEKVRGALFSVVLVRNCQLFAAFGATHSQYATTIGCQHALTETVLVVSFAVVRLKCPFHDSILFYFYFLLT